MPWPSVEWLVRNLWADGHVGNHVGKRGTAVDISCAQNAPCSSMSATTARIPSLLYLEMLPLSRQIEKGFNSYLVRDWPLCLQLYHNVAGTRMYVHVPVTHLVMICMTMTRSSIRKRQGGTLPWLAGAMYFPVRDVGLHISFQQQNKGSS